MSKEIPIIGHHVDNPWDFGNMTVGDAIKLNKKERSKMRKVDWDKTIICGVSLGFMASTLYLLLVIAAQITA